MSWRKLSQPFCSCVVGSKLLSSNWTLKFPQSSSQIQRFYSTGLAIKKKGRSTSFPVLSGGATDTTTTEYKDNSTAIEAIIAKYQEVLKIATSGGGEKGIKLHTEKNKKLFLTDKLELILDDTEDFLELSPLAGMGMEYGSVPRATLLSGIGKVNGTYCLVMINDGSIKGGTIFPISNKKSNRSFDICQQHYLPNLCLVDSGGAFLPLQAEIFPDRNHGGRVFYNEAISNSMNIPQLAIVCGSCTAGGAYLPTMMQENIIVHKLGTMFLGGPPLVFAATGEVTTAEQLGGATLHTSESGCLDHFAQNEEDAYEQARSIITTFNIPETNPPEGFDEPLFDANELLGLVPRKHQHQMDAYKVIARVVDGSRFQEFKAKYGTSLVTGFAHVKGNMVGIVANHQGPITEDAASKGAHFVGLCDQRNIPVVFLQNTYPNKTVCETQEEAEMLALRLRGHARLMSAVACAQIPKLTFIIGNSFGAENYLMCGRSMSPNFLFTWPNAQIAMNDPMIMAQQIVQEKVGSSVSPTGEEFKESMKEVMKSLMKSSNAMYSSSRVWDDGIVLPQDTRHMIARCLDIINQGELVPRRDLKSPVIRL